MQLTRFHVTKSKSGHYTLTVKTQTDGGPWVTVARVVKLSSLSKVVQAKIEYIASIGQKTGGE